MSHDPSRRRARRALAMLAATSCLGVAACGVPDSTGFEAFDQGQFGFDQTTTSSTTTTSAATIPNPSTSGEVTTTIVTESVTLYFLAGNELSSVSIALASPASPQQVIAALVGGPPQGQVGTGLRTAIPDDVELLIRNTRGGVEVDMPIGFFDNIPPADQRLAVAQLVLTLTERGGIGSVQFTSNGVPRAVPLGSGASTQPGTAVYREDYAQLLATDESPDVTVTSTLVGQP